MEGARLRRRWTITAALLGFLPLTFLLPGAFALQCHSHSFIQPVFGEKINYELSVTSSLLANCLASQTACVEAHLLLSTEKMGMLVTHRGCANEGLKDQAESATSSDRHLTIRSSVLYCHSDLCNKNLTDLNVFKMPRQAKAPEASSSNQCYSGFTMDPNEDILDRVTCGRDYTQCYHGNGTITAGNLAVDFSIKTCQRPSCDVPESQSFGPIELKQWGSCCHGIFCNGKGAAPQKQNITKADPTQDTSTPHEEEPVTQTTDFTKDDIVNVTQNTFPDYESTIKTTTTSPQNPLYDSEENEDYFSILPDGTNDTLNPRGAKSLGPPKSSLSFYLLVVALGIAILGLW
uniref:ly6/PLAUR domain-containing protein 5-like n=1 Tax=Euleptes europaea TaxID=460621 RepID=UPI00253FBDE3|nr:ly6/PLAUR domain-containing protein 5-like [Euleptes europaea]